MNISCDRTKVREDCPPDERCVTTPFGCYCSSEEEENPVGQPVTDGLRTPVQLYVKEYLKVRGEVRQRYIAVDIPVPLEDLLRLTPVSFRAVSVNGQTDLLVATTIWEYRTITNRLITISSSRSLEVGRTENGECLPFNIRSSTGIVSLVFSSTLNRVGTSVPSLDHNVIINPGALPQFEKSDCMPQGVSGTNGSVEFDITAVTMLLGLVIGATVKLAQTIVTESGVENTVCGEVTQEAAQQVVDQVPDPQPVEDPRIAIWKQIGALKPKNQSGSLRQCQRDGLP